MYIFIYRHIYICIHQNEYTHLHPCFHMHLCVQRQKSIPRFWTIGITASYELNGQQMGKKRKSDIMDFVSSTYTSSATHQNWWLLCELTVETEAVGWIASPMPIVVSLETEFWRLPYDGSPSIRQRGGKISRPFAFVSENTSSSRNQ